MRKALEEKILMFRAVNGLAMREEIVIFGSTFMANFPFYELSQKYILHSAVYNRSVENLTLEEAELVVNECAIDLKPKKLFLSLGENDLENTHAIAIYQRFLLKLKQLLPNTKIYVLPIQIEENAKNDGSVSAFNEQLRCLCERMHTVFLDLSIKDHSKALYEKLFKKLNCFFYDGRLNLVDAFSFA